jgi:high-affinity iron transporter
LSELPGISIFGLFPTLQSVAAQIAVLLALVIGFAWNRKMAARPVST